MTDLVIEDQPSMRDLAKLLDVALNNQHRPRREGFILLRFRHGEITRPGYIATCREDEAIKLLKLAIAQLQGRITGEGGHS